MTFKRPKTFLLNSKSYAREKLIKGKFIAVLTVVHLKTYPEFFVVCIAKTAINISF